MFEVSEGWKIEKVEGSQSAHAITHLECKRSHTLIVPNQDSINSVISFHEQNKCKMTGPGERLKK